MTGLARSTVLISHPSPDLYGSDLQLLETVSAFTEKNHNVIVVLPKAGELTVRLEQRGAKVIVHSFPVSRKSLLSARALPAYLIDTVKSTFELTRLVNQTKPSVIIANTLTIPVWFLVARVARMPLVCHVHEAEETKSRVLNLLLAGPLMLCNLVIVNSNASAKVLTGSLPKLSRKIRRIYNGVPDTGLPRPMQRLDRNGPIALLMLGRLSPRKGTDLALEAAALLRERHYDVRLRICGSAFSGYEWFEQDLVDRAAKPDLAGYVEFLGYVDGTESELAASQIVLIPSRAEPFGNVAVEAQMAGRPVVATDVQGLAEVIEHNRTGLLAKSDSAVHIADCIEVLVNDPDRAEKMSSVARSSALRRFSTSRYRADIYTAVATTIPRTHLPDSEPRVETPLDHQQGAGA